MEEQNIQQTAVQETVPQGHKKILYIAVGFSLLAVVLIVVALVKIIQPGSQLPSISQETGQNQGTKTSGTNQEPLAGQTVTAPVPINNSQDVDNALEQIDGMDPSGVETDLNQNTADASQFSQ